MKEIATCLLPPTGKSGSFITPRPGAKVRGLLKELLESSLVLQEDWDALVPEQRQNLVQYCEDEALLSRLADVGLLTEYQANRIEAGTHFGLILGNYRVLERLGAGGMGVVFRAEHIRMRRQVAIKVLPFGPEHDPRLLRRFMTEIRAIAQLQHPNIVGAIDAGETSDRSGTVLHFFVMEYVPGQDLEEYVRAQGPLPPAKACDLMHQVASALAEAHKHNLVHRDIKPSNIQITPEGQAKLLDFGLARRLRSGTTEPGTLLGTLDYMAPEQIQDASGVDIRADLYGLGGVLYWCLTGETPFPSKGSMVEELAARMHKLPPSVCGKRPNVPAELNHLVKKLMALQPDDRFATPQEVMRALLPFLKSDGQEFLPRVEPMPVRDGGPDTPGAPRVHQVLIVDDEPSIRTFSKFVLHSDGLQCAEVGAGLEALEAVRQKNYDLILLDVNLPDMEGTDVCKKLREHPPCPNLKIIMVSGGTNGDIMAQLLLSGADDFLTKPFSLVQLQARVKAALRLKEAQDRTDLLHRHLRTVNQELERSLGARTSDLVDARNALVLALAKLVEHRANETGAHLGRLQQYCRCLAEEAGRTPSLADQIDANFVELLECCAPLHDVGKVALPDHILLKPGKLDPEERVLMQTHTVIGAETLEEVAKQHGASVAFLQMAIDIARHHHERYDGTGYPDGLAGTDIPLAARIVAIGDVYDALRSRRPYKPALSHNAALQVILDSPQQHFDPVLLQAFERVAPQFERFYREMPD